MTGPARIAAPANTLVVALRLKPIRPTPMHLDAVNAQSPGLVQ
jgi:hypothetical protein